MARTTRTSPTRQSDGILRSRMRGLVVALLAMSIALALPQAASASLPSQSAHRFPRLAEWWGNSSLATNARRDYYVAYNEDPLTPNTSAMATMRSLNPSLLLLASSSAAELDFSETDKASFDAQRIGAIPTSWLLLQVGSTLSAPLTAGATTFAVADLSKFRVDDLVVVDDEKCLVTGVSGGLTVKRGYAGSTATTHASGARVAAVVTDWPYAATLDMTANCPLGRATGAFATPTGQTERAADWLARRTAGIADAASWDGVMVDVCIATYSHSFRDGTTFRTVADRTNPSAEVDYAAFDQAWQAGLEAYLARVRSLVDDDQMVVTNGAPPVYSSTNGNTFETFPTASTSSLEWHSVIIGPTPDSRGGSYLDWSNAVPKPNLTTMFTMGGQTDYRMMRFGLTTTLMGNGYYSFKTMTPGTDFSGYWYDEYDNAGAGRGYLGNPLGAAYCQAPGLNSPDLLGGFGGFESQASLNAWEFYPREDEGYSATRSLDGGTAKIAITRSAGTIWGVQFSRPNIPVTSGRTYTLSFRARADKTLPIRAVLQQANSPHTIYAVTDEMGLTTDWRWFEVPLTATGSDSAADMLLSVGKAVGTVWVDDVTLREGDRNVYRRDYEGGTALVNATAAPVTVALGSSFRKIRGTQAPQVNDGSLVNAVVIPARDGLVLLRPSAAEAQCTPVYRFYNRTNGSHFYTADPNEYVRVHTQLSATFSYDGVAYAPNLGNPTNGAMLYRFFNKKNGSHFYTASEAEKNNVLSKLSKTYSLDGPAYSVSLSPVPGALTVYRFYNKKNGSHFYTASEAEKNNVLSKLSKTYSLDGPAFWVVQ